jgi:hypothetical protein
MAQMKKRIAKKRIAKKRPPKTSAEVCGFDAAKMTELGREAALTAKQLRYFALRAEGVTAHLAVRRAGYNAKNKRNELATAHWLDGRLRDKGLLDAALLDAGVTMTSFVKALKSGLDGEDPRLAISAAKYLGTILGYGQEAREEPEAYGDSYEMLQQLRQAVAGAIQPGAVAPAAD